MSSGHVFTFLLGVASWRRGGSILLVLMILSAPAVEPLTSIAVIRSLPRSESGKRPPVLVRGVITFRWPVPWNSFCIQSDEGGLWISTSIARREQLLAEDDTSFDTLREGDEVEVTGLLNAPPHAVAWWRCSDHQSSRFRCHCKRPSAAYAGAER